MSDNIPALRVSLIAALLAGCSPQSDMQMSTQQNRSDTPHATFPPAGVESVGQRVDVTRIGVFDDQLAYDNKRGVYIITDHQTGKEFIGVSGIGITETGRHNCGKSCTREDER